MYTQSFSTYHIISSKLCTLPQKNLIQIITISISSSYINHNCKQHENTSYSFSQNFTNLLIIRKASIFIHFLNNSPIHIYTTNSKLPKSKTRTTKNLENQQNKRIPLYTVPPRPLPSCHTSPPSSSIYSSNSL